mgnify:FL=1
MIPTLGIIYLAVVVVIISGIIYITFAELFKGRMKINLKLRKGESDGGKKKKKKATTSKTKA